MKKFVRIQSNVTIMVTPGLQFEDLTNKEVALPDRLKVNAQWPKMTVLVKQGAHWYPSEIATWPAVKALEKDNVLTLGQFSDEIDGDIQEVLKDKERINEAAKEFVKEVKKVANIDLEDVAK